MPEPRRETLVEVPVDAEGTRETLRALADELHAMSQPMTALLCRLEIGSLGGTIEGYAEAVREGLVECDRLTRSIGTMRTMVGRALDR